MDFRNGAFGSRTCNAFVESINNERRQRFKWQNTFDKLKETYPNPNYYSWSAMFEFTKNVEECEKPFKLPELVFPEKIEKKRNEILRYMKTIQQYQDHLNGREQIYPKSNDSKRVTFNVMNERNCKTCQEEKTRYLSKIKHPFPIDPSTASWDDLNKAKVSLDSSNMNFQEGLKDLLKSRPKRVNY